MDMTKFAESEYLTTDKIENSKTKRGIVISDVTELDGKFGKKAELMVEIDMIRKKWNPNKVSVQNLIVGFGVDSKSWLGKEVIFSVEKTEKGDKTIIGKPYTVKIESLN